MTEHTQCSHILEAALTAAAGNRHHMIRMPQMPLERLCDKRLQHARPRSKRWDRPQHQIASFRRIPLEFGTRCQPRAVQAAYAACIHRKGVNARSLWAMLPRACVRKYATRPLVATKAGSPAAPAVVYLNLPPQRAGRMPLIVLLKTIPWAHTFHSIETDVLMGAAALACCRCQCFSSLDPMCVVVCAVGPCG